MKIIFIQFLFCSIVLFTLNSCIISKDQANFTYIELNTKDYESKLKTEKSNYIIDVRTTGEFSKGHLENAQNINFFGKNLKQKIKAIPKDKTIFLYCHTQHRSPLFAKKLKKAGFKQVYDLKGGFIQWKNENMPYLIETVE